MSRDSSLWWHTATAPSNIAFIKYWGKRSAETQWPANDSLSMTLSEACTTTLARCLPSNEIDRFQLGDLNLASDHPKARRALAHVARLRTITGFTPPLAIVSENSFPEGRGIASSASGFAALTIACLAAWTVSPDLDHLARHGYSLTRLADLARLGSGSACRSLFGGFARWESGDAHDHQHFRQLFRADHWALADIILCGPSEKKISSTDGHVAAWSSPSFAPRLRSLPDRLRACEAAIAARRMADLGNILESEALEMHGVMESSVPPVVYLSDTTRRLLETIREYRARGGFPAWFTLDAGETIHLICESRHAPQIVTAARAFTPERMILMDRVGDGPTLELRKGPAA